MKNEVYLNKILAFLEQIKIKVIEKELPNETLLSGLELESDNIFVDYNKLKYQGDFLQAAGLIAVTSKNNRILIGSKKNAPDWPTQSDKMSAILWSFAAATFIKIPLDFLFHKNGYEGSSEWLIETFSDGNYIGLPFLQWSKMAYSNEEVLKNGKQAFPAMKNWIRPE